MYVINKLIIIVKYIYCLYIIDKAVLIFYDQQIITVY